MKNSRLKRLCLEYCALLVNKTKQLIEKKANSVESDRYKVNRGPKLIFYGLLCVTHLLYE